MTNFTADLSFGRESETHFANYFSNTSWTPTLAPNYKFPDYDVSISSGSSTITFEIKTDRWTPKTNNVAIEIGRDGEPTGLQTTKADYFVIRVKDIYYGVKTSTLKQYIEDNAEFLRVKQVGDGERTTCVLLPFYEFKNMTVFAINDMVLIQSLLPIIKDNAK